MLLAASALVFVIACSNVANLILARTVRREGELAIRAALGASTGALRRTLLAESLLLCGAGAALGVLSARPMVAILARYASRFSVRALDLTVDSSMLWVGAVLAVVAAVLLAFVPRLPSADTSHGFGLSNGSVRITGSTEPAAAGLRGHADRRVVRAAGGREHAAQDAARAAGGADRLRHAPRARDNVPVMSYGRTPDQIVGFYKEAIRRITSCRAWTASRSARWFRGATRAASVLASSSRPMATSAAGRRRSARRGSAPSRPDFSRRSAFRSSPGAISTMPIAEAASRS